ncbi:MAG: DegV family EDD domain-containing protein [Chloroflexi bacterium]|nr:DegV family EDD domain-containing protein [Chloroflexota bacterium]
MHLTEIDAQVFHSPLHLCVVYAYLNRLDVLPAAAANGFRQLAHQEYGAAKTLVLRQNPHPIDVEPARTLVAEVQRMAGRARSYFLVPTLEYLQRGGRIGGAAALLGSVLQVKPILEIHDGRVQVLERVRVLSRARERMLELTVDHCRRSLAPRRCVMHADVPSEALSLAEDLRRRLGGPLPSIYEVGAAIATHAGPGVTAAGFFVG